MAESGGTSVAEKLDQMVAGLNDLEKEMKELTDVFLMDSSVKSRLCGVGILPKKEAYEYGAVGPTLTGKWVVNRYEETGLCSVFQITF